MNFKQLLIGITLLFLGGCGGVVTSDWKSRSQYDRVVWADDSSEVAVVALRFEERSGGLLSGTTEKRQFQHRIFAQKINNPEQRALTDWRDHQNGEIYYMKQAGYFVVESLLDDGSRRFDKIDLEGKEILIIETPNTESQPCKEVVTGPNVPLPAKVAHSIIPSPDGRQLAHVYSSACGKVTVEFLYANNLTFISEQTLDIDQPVEALWHPEGYLVIVTTSLNKAWKIQLNEPPLPIPPTRCIAPKTTSSDISLDGQLAYFEGEKVMTKRVGPQSAFGCR